MSQYIQFFIRSKNDEFLPIGTFSRCTQIYQLLYTKVPYEKIMAINFDSLKEYQNYADEEKKRYEKLIEDRKDEIDFLIQCTQRTCTLEGLLLKRFEITQDIEQFNQEIKEIKMAKSYLYMLREILEAVEYDSDYDVNHYLYVGIEVDPSVDKIEV